MWAKAKAVVALLSLQLFAFSFALPGHRNSAISTSSDRSGGGKTLQSRGFTISDTDWENAVQKGNVWVLAMEASEEKAQEYLKLEEPVTSPFTSYSALDRWGWTQERSTFDPVEGSSFTAIFSELKINPANSEEISWTHSKEFKDDNGEDMPVSVL